MFRVWKLKLTQFSSSLHPKATPQGPTGPAGAGVGAAVCHSSSCWNPAPSACALSRVRSQPVLPPGRPSLTEASACSPPGCAGGGAVRTPGSALARASTPVPKCWSPADGARERRLSTAAPGHHPPSAEVPTILVWLRAGSKGPHRPPGHPGPATRPLGGPLTPDATLEARRLLPVTG